MAPGDAAETVTEAALPSWVSNLKVLLPFTTGLVTLMSNPKEWLEEYVYVLVAEWLVGGILDAAQYTLGWIIFAFELTAETVLSAAGPLASPFQIISSAMIGVIETIYAAAVGVAHTAGLAGPPAVAFAIALLSAVLAMVAYALIKVIPGSDALEGAVGVFRK